MSKFSRAPRPKPVKLDDFIEGAENRRDEPPTADRVPTPLAWEDPMVRNDVLKAYNLRLPEPYLLKLKFIASNTPVSMHAFCMAELLPAIDRKVEEILSRSQE
jgi:hypothetical protein